jgi:choline kinase
MMQAIILAAGLGQRIKHITTSIPKCLIEVNGRRIIDYQIEVLNNSGINDITVAVGHLKGKIIELLGNKVSYVENNLYKDSNSSYSLWLAKSLISSEFIYLNGDLIFNEKILKKLISDDAENAIIIDTSKVDIYDDMFKAHLRDGRVMELNKNMEPGRVSGAAPGPVKFSKAGRDTLFEELGEVMLTGDRHQWCYSIFSKIACKIQLKGINIAGLPWLEIDTSEDLDKARKLKFF